MTIREKGERLYMSKTDIKQYIYIQLYPYVRTHVSLHLIAYVSLAKVSKQVGNVFLSRRVSRVSRYFVKGSNS